MPKKFDAKNITERIVHNSKYYKNEANEIYMSYGPQPEKGVFLMSAPNLDPIIISVAKMPLSAGQKEVVRQLITNKAQKIAANQQVFNRVGFKDGNIYLDRGADRVTKVSPDSIKELKKSPVPFCRSKTAKDLLAPVISGDVSNRQGLKMMKKLVNVSSEQFPLVVAGVMSIFLPKGTRPILILEGIQGSAKSSTMRNLTRLVDPHQPPYVSMPTREKDLFINCHNRALAGFDNVSDIKPHVSDWLCQIATGGATASRKLYTDGDEFIIYAHALIILNGITTNAVRGDLLDRAIKIEAPFLAPEKRQTETELEEKFLKFHPVILGVLLRMAQYGLKNPRKLPDELKGSRLADFCEWTYSWAPAAGINPEKLIKKIVENQRRAKLEVLNEDTVTSIILELLEDNDGTWEGRSTNLFQEFSIIADNRKGAKLKNLPQSPQGLTGWLKRSMPSLKAAGINIASKHANKGRWYKISSGK